MKAVLSIQSEVAYGHVGHSAAVFPLQRLGFDVWPIHTVQLGHHPGYGRFRGHLVEPERVAVILEAVLETAPLDRCAALLVGYLGGSEIGDIVVQAMDRLKAVQPGLTILLDPVIGDDGAGVFVREGVPPVIQDQLLPRACILTPNRFELAYLSGFDVDDLDQAKRAASYLLDQGPRLVVATGLSDPKSRDALFMLAVSKEEQLLIQTPKLSRSFSGTGDAFSALLLGHSLLAPDLKTGFERAASAIFTLVEMTERLGEEELSLIAAQDCLVKPEVRFKAEAL